MVTISPLTNWKINIPLDTTFLQDRSHQHIITKQELIINT